MRTGKLYGNVDQIHERHRHRYEVNTDFVPQMEAKGLKFVGHDENNERMEIVELEGEQCGDGSYFSRSDPCVLSGHPFFLAVQFHPEFKTRPLHPSPPFLGFILASCGMLKQYLESSSNPSKVNAPMTGYKSMSDLHDAIETGNVVVVPRSNSNKRLGVRRDSSVGSFDTDGSGDRPANGGDVEVNEQ